MKTKIYFFEQHGKIPDDAARQRIERKVDELVKRINVARRKQLLRQYEFHAGPEINNLSNIREIMMNDLDRNDQNFFVFMSPDHVGMEIFSGQKFVDFFLDASDESQGKNSPWEIGQLCAYFEGE